MSWETLGIIVFDIQRHSYALGMSGSSHAASTGAPGENTSAVTGTECAEQGAPRQQIRDPCMQHVRQ